MKTQKNTNPIFQKGETVRFLNEVGGGTVVKYMHNGHILVRADDGFEYPMPPSELIKIETEDIQDNVGGPSQPQGEKERDAADYSVEENARIGEIYLAFLQDEAHHLEIFLINESEYFLRFTAYLKDPKKGFSLLENDELEPHTKMQIGELVHAELNDISAIAVQGMFFGEQLKDLIRPVYETHSLNASRLMQDSSYKASPYFAEKACLRTLFSPLKDSKGGDIRQVLKEKAAQAAIDKEKLARSKPHKAPEMREVDLHINELVDDVRGMSNAEILQHQMAHFHKELNAAIKDKLEKIVFIHGIGNGTLKNSLRHAVENEYKLEYQDASFKDYGFGATMVYVGRGK